tara:strand:- start:519 stop:938 length:420 start_codon:yes stop_codon:yes gene_type:complete
MIICETEFITPDPNDPEIALNEVDYYAWIPQTPGVPNHRLSLRYRFSTGQYEVYAMLVKREVTPFVGAIAVTQRPTGTEVTRFISTSLQEAIDYADNQWHLYHDSWAHDGGKQNDQVCTHQYPTRAFGCKIKKEVIDGY